MAFATNNAVRLYWRFDGDPTKPVLLLLNSIGADLALWDLAAPQLKTRFRLLRMDTRGHGASDAPAGDYSLDLLADDALAVLRAAGVDKATVCGLSLGGMVAMTLALKAPARVEALVLACTSSALDPVLWQERISAVRAKGMAAVAEAAMQRFFAPAFRRQHPEIAGGIETGLLAMDPNGYSGCGAAIRDMSLASQLASIAVPTLVIAGKQDVSTPLAGHGDRLLSDIPGATGARLDAAHLACLEAPAAFSSAVIAFSEALSNGGTREAADALFEAGLKMRRQVLGDPWVDKSLARRTPFNADFQALITRIAWGEIWTRPGLDQRTRRLLVLAICAALGRWEEFRLHTRAGLEQGGFDQEALKETLMQTAIYAGVPAANTAFAEAADVIDALAAEQQPN